VSDDADLERKAHDAWESGRRTAAFRLYSQLATRGSGAGELNLGYFYDCGIGVRKNRALALKWYRRAYRRGSGAGASNIATIYRDEGKHRLEAQWYARAVRLKETAMPQSSLPSSYWRAEVFAKAGRTPQGCSNAPRVVASSRRMAATRPEQCCMH
jgi:TPR repeat protein